MTAMDIRLADLFLSYRTAQCLQAAGLETLAQLNVASDAELLAIAGIGRKGLALIRAEAKDLSGLRRKLAAAEEKAKRVRHSVELYQEWEDQCRAEVVRLQGLLGESC